MDDEQMRLHLAERWEPKDYLEAISAVEGIYYVLAFRHEFTDCPWLFDLWDEPYYRDRMYRRRRPGNSLDTIRAGLIDHARALANYEQRLFVTKVSHASPGFIDFEGLGDVIRAVKEAVGDTVGFFTRRKIREEENKQAELETEKRRLDIESAKIQIARDKLALLDEIQDRKDRYFPPEMRPQLERVLVTELGKIETLAAKGLLTDQRDHDDDD